AIAGNLLYAFACTHDMLTFHCTLSRVDLARLLERSGWTYWDGAHWNTDLHRARAVLDGASITSVQFNAHLGKWTAIYSAVESNDVLLRAAPALAGPWSEPVTLFTADRKGHEGPTYDAQ